MGDKEIKRLLCWVRYTQQLDNKEGVIHNTYLNDEDIFTVPKSFIPEAE